MVSTLKIEDRLEGATNSGLGRSGFSFSWKVEVVVPSPNDPQELAAHKEEEVKAKQVLLDSVKYHLFPHISESQPRICLMLW
jgi:hypothetical protein